MIIFVPTYVWFQGRLELPRNSRLICDSYGSAGKKAIYALLSFARTNVALTPQNFDIFIDVGDRFVISVNPEEVSAVNARDPEQQNSWEVLNALCQKVRVILSGHIPTTKGPSAGFEVCQSCVTRCVLLLRSIYSDYVRRRTN
jgi:hypothetical protein